MAANQCSKCDEIFPSRNRLFQHLRTCSTSASSEPTEESENLKRLKKFHEISVQNDENLYVYVVGGRLRGRTLTGVHKYNVVANTWESSKSMIENRGSHGAVCVNGVLYAIGGGGLHSNLSTCESFDGVAWTRAPALNVSRHALSVTTIGDRIYAVGGWVDGTLCSGAVEVLDTSANESDHLWVNLPSLTLPRRLHGVASYGSKLYAFGGSCDDPHWHTDTTEVFDTNSPTDQWAQLPTRIPCSGGVSAVAVYPFIYLFLHGRNVCRYDPDADSYTNLSALPVHDWHCFDAKGVSPVSPPSLLGEDHPSHMEGLGTTQIYLLGGASSGKWGTFAFRYDIPSDSWSELCAMTQAKRRLACAVVREPLRGLCSKESTES